MSEWRSAELHKEALVQFWEAVQPSLVIVAFAVLLGRTYLAGGISIRELARRVGVHNGYLGRVLKGTIRAALNQS
jgi:hypothetical protein